MTGLKTTVKHVRFANHQLANCQLANYQRKTLDAAYSILDVMGSDDFDKSTHKYLHERG